jgi:hypothetical protein
VLEQAKKSHDDAAARTKAGRQAEAERRVARTRWPRRVAVRNGVVQ